LRKKRFIVLDQRTILYGLKSDQLGYAADEYCKHTIIKEITFTTLVHIRTQKRLISIIYQTK